MFRRFLAFFAALWCFYGALAKEVRIPVVASGDLHGNLLALQMRIVPALEEIERQNGVKPIYCDLGDVAEGSYVLLRSHGAGAAEAFNLAGVELFVPGNHDVSFGLPYLARFMQEFQGTTLAANLHFPEAGNAFLPFTVVEREGFRIAFIGLMLKNMNSALPVPESRFQTAAALDTLPAVMDEVRKLRPDAVVLLRHAGLYGGGENLSDVLRVAPGVDLVIGSHTHQAEAGVMMRSSWYVQPGAHAESLALATLIFDDESRQLRQIESELLPLDPVAEENPELDAPASSLMQGGDGIVAEKMRKAAGADVAIYAMGSAEAWRKLRKNPAPTVRDYQEVFTYFDPVVTVTVSAAELKAIVQEYATFAAERKMPLTIAGGKYKMKIGRLERLEMDKKQPQYRLAITAYAAAGAGGNLPTTRAVCTPQITPEALDQAKPLLEILLP